MISLFLSLFVCGLFLVFVVGFWIPSIAVDKIFVVLNIA